MKNVKVSLAWQILLALVLGILLGSYLHYHSDSREWLIANLLSPAGDIFIHLIKMIVVPIVISTLVVGIAEMGEVKSLGKVGLRTLIYTVVVSSIAVAISLALVGDGLAVCGKGECDQGKHAEDDTPALTPSALRAFSPLPTGEGGDPLGAAEWGG